MPKRIEVRISGVGGQGVILAGKILGRAAAIYDRKHAIQTQSYGAEARGSSAKSEVIISDEKINFPMVRRCDILVAMSQSALKKHLKDLKEDGILLVDEDAVKEKMPKVRAEIFKVPATKIAENKFKSKIYANAVILGALTKTAGIVSKGAMEEAIADSVPQKTKQNNLNAFKIGLEYFTKE